jgi:hypothetical protein
VKPICVLLACEFTGTFRDAFTRANCNATSCDLLPSETPGQHIQGDVIEHLNPQYDLMIAFPPCTYLSYAGQRWWYNRKSEQDQAIEFFRLLLSAPIPRICVENPQGIIFTAIRKPDQTLHPWQFGDPYAKRTCLWLKNLPPLIHTHCLTRRESWTQQTCMRLTWRRNNPRRRARQRSFPGVASAAADQWVKSILANPVISDSFGDARAQRIKHNRTY